MSGFPEDYNEEDAERRMNVIGQNGNEGTHYPEVHNSIVYGRNCVCNHSNCIVIGDGLVTDRDNQLLIGDQDFEGDWDLDERELILIRNVIGAFIKTTQAYERD